MNIIQTNIMLPRGIFLVIIGIIIAGGSELLYPYFVAPYETSLIEYDELWGVPLFQDRTYSKDIVFEDEVNEILFFVDYEPLSKTLLVEVLDKDSKTVFQEEISEKKFVTKPFSPQPNSSYELKITNLDRFYVDIWDLGYENYFPEKTDYVVPDDEWYSYLAVAVFLLGVSLAIIGGILFFKERQKIKLSHLSASKKKLENTHVNIIIQVLLCVFIPLLSLVAFYRIKKLREGIIIVLGSVAFYVAIFAGLPIPGGSVASFTFLYLVPLFFVLMWSFEWNNSIIKK